MPILIHQRIIESIVHFKVNLREQCFELVSFLRTAGVVASFPFYFLQTFCGRCEKHGIHGDHLEFVFDIFTGDGEVISLAVEAARAQMRTLSTCLPAIQAHRQEIAAEIQGVNDRAEMVSKSISSFVARLTEDLKKFEQALLQDVDKHRWKQVKMLDCLDMKVKEVMDKGLAAKKLIEE